MKTTCINNGNVTRDYAVDFVKGVLVLLMVIYHSFNYFVSDPDIYLKYIRIIAGAFVFMSGFLQSHVIIPKYSSELHVVVKKSIFRGLRLIALFIILNTMIVLVIPVSNTGSTLMVSNIFQHVKSVFLRGDGTVTAFEVLLPIGYFLLLSAVYISLYRYGTNMIIILSILFYIGTVVQSTFLTPWYNIELICLGIVGFNMGLFSSTQVENFISRYHIPVWIAYIFSLIWISFFPQTYIVHSLYVLVTVVWLYSIGRKWFRLGVIALCLQRFGKYSLFSYIFQIALLQVLARLVRGRVSPPWALFLSIWITILAILLTIYIIDHVRKKSPALNTVYRWILG